MRYDEYYIIALSDSILKKSDWITGCDILMGRFIKSTLIR
jgi:hypothetical protein